MGLIQDRKKRLMKKQRGTWERRTDRVQSVSGMSDSCHDGVEEAELGNIQLLRSKGETSVDMKDEQNIRWNRNRGEQTSAER